MDCVRPHRHLAIPTRKKPYDIKLEKLSSENGFEVVRFKRHVPPVHYKIKIESFSSLQDTLKRNGGAKVESAEFTTGGYTWVLSIYPNGNTAENGNYHLSLSLRIVNKLSVGNTINATIGFFIHDQIRDNYLVVQDLREKRFDVLKNEWGIAKVLPLSFFMDDANGFLINDDCVFGAEVFVIGGQAKTSSISMLKETTPRTFTWKVEKFSGWLDAVYSPSYLIEGRSWKLSLYPKGNGAEKNKSVSLFLILNDTSDLTYGKKLYVEYEVCLKNQEKGEDFVKSGSVWLYSGMASGGHRALLPLREAESSYRGYKVDDVVIIELNIKALFSVKDMQ